MHTTHPKVKNYLGNSNYKCSRHAKRRTKNKERELKNTKISFALEIESSNEHAANNQNQPKISIDRTLHQIGFKTTTHCINNEINNTEFFTLNGKLFNAQMLRIFFKQKTKTSIFIAQPCQFSKNKNDNQRKSRDATKEKSSYLLNRILNYSEYAASEHILIVTFEKLITNENLQKITSITKESRRLITFMIFEIPDADASIAISYLSILNNIFSGSPDVGDVITPRGIYRHVVENLTTIERRPVFITNTPEGAEIHRFLL